jgi:hypothetical protein
MSSWKYFHKQADPGESLEIYADIESKVAKNKRLLGYLIIFLPIYLMGVINIFPLTYS